jgi:hypothetical protein
VTTISTPLDHLIRLLNNPLLLLLLLLLLLFLFLFLTTFFSTTSRLGREHHILDLRDRPTDPVYPTLLHGDRWIGRDHPEGPDCTTIGSYTFSHLEHSLYTLNYETGREWELFEAGTELFSSP